MDCCYLSSTVAAPPANTAAVETSMPYFRMNVGNLIIAEGALLSECSKASTKEKSVSAPAWCAEPRLGGTCVINVVMPKVTCASS